MRRNIRSRESRSSGGAFGQRPEVQEKDDQDCLATSSRGGKTTLARKVENEFPGRVHVTKTLPQENGVQAM